MQYWSMLPKLLIRLEQFDSLDMICWNDRYKAGGFEKALRLAKKVKEHAEAVVGSEVKFKIYIRKDWGAHEYDFVDL